MSRSRARPQMETEAIGPTARKKKEGQADQQKARAGLLRAQLFVQTLRSYWHADEQQPEDCVEGETGEQTLGRQMFYGPCRFPPSSAKRGRHLSKMAPSSAQMA